MSEKSRKMHGREVSREEAISVLGKPSAEWERNSRDIDFRGRLRPGQSDLDIQGIRGYGVSDTGHRGYLQRSLERPLGVDTGLVTAEENEMIRVTLRAETLEILERYEVRLAELERSAVAVREYLGRLEFNLSYLRKKDLGKPEDEPTEELAALNVASQTQDRNDIAAVEAQIAEYKAKLAALEQKH